MIVVKWNTENDSGATQVTINQPTLHCSGTWVQVLRIQRHMCYYNVANQSQILNTNYWTMRTSL